MSGEKKLAHIRHRVRPSGMSVKDQAATNGRPTNGATGYTVGYGKPPLHSRFQRGTSGNPRGRPKGARSVSTLLREELQSKIVVRENGREITITKLQAMIKRVVTDTLNGKAQFVKILLSMLDQEGAEPEDRTLSRADAELLQSILGDITND